MVDDILSEAPLYKHLVRQGKEEGIKKGIKQGIKQGSILTSRKMLLALVQKRFPQLSTLAQKTISTLGKLDVLEQLTLEIATAQDEEEARSYLLVV